MTVTLHLTPELESGLLAQAQDKGLPLEEYLLTLVEKATSPCSETNCAETNASAERAEAVAGMLEFGEKYRLSLDQPITRAFLHEDHRF